ncbi:MAG: recombination mediator RecR [Planctomycetota bacterium]
MAYPTTVMKLIHELMKLPGVGSRTADRLAFHLLRTSEADALALARAIAELRARVRYCSECFNVAESDPCEVCGDATRDRTRLLVVEHPKDLLAFERTGYRGRYHVLHGRLSPMEGMDASHITLPELINRVRDGSIREVILATNPDLEGDGTALTIVEQLRGSQARVTRLARGVPSGSSIEYASTAVLADALHGRIEMNSKMAEDDA